MLDFGGIQQSSMLDAGLLAIQSKHTWDATKMFWKAVGRVQEDWTSESEWDDVLAAVADGADLSVQHKYNSYMKSGFHHTLDREAPLSVVEAIVEELRGRS